MTEDFPSALARARIRAGLKQAELALQLGTTQPTISKWERGVEPPSAEFHAGLAEFLEVDRDDLIRMFAAPSARLTQIGRELHRLVDELLDAAREGRIE